MYVITWFDHVLFFDLLTLPLQLFTAVQSLPSYASFPPLKIARFHKPFRANLNRKQRVALRHRSGLLRISISVGKLVVRSCDLDKLIVLHHLSDTTLYASVTRCQVNTFIKSLLNSCKSFSLVDARSPRNFLKVFVAPVHLVLLCTLSLEPISSFSTFHHLIGQVFPYVHHIQLRRS